MSKPFTASCGIKQKETKVKLERGLVFEDENEAKTERLRESISMEYSAQLGAVMLLSYFVSNQPLMYVVM